MTGRPPTSCEVIEKKELKVHTRVKILACYASKEKYN
jgi:hypothetical protein